MNTNPARRAVAFLFLLLPALAFAADAPSPTPSPAQDQSHPLTPAHAFTPTSDYAVKNIEGWKVYVEKALLDKHADLADKAVKLLAVKLYDIKRVVPPGPLADIMQVPIWLEYDNPIAPCAVQHPSRQWLVEHHFNPDKAHSVNIANAKRFLSWSHVQPWMVLHELAHAYHHHFLDADARREITETYEAAKASGIYEHVLYYSGQTKRHYAMNNPDEYFAESSEAFFGTNDFYPFVRPELEKFDPRMYHLLQKLWHVNNHP